MKWIALMAVCLALVGCQNGSGSVTEKVLADFGLRDHPEGHVSGSDRVFEELERVGEAELRRLNASERHGEVVFEGEGVHGRFHKEVKVYESFHPLDVRAVTGGGTRDRGYTGTIEYRYTMLRGTPKSTRTEAAAESASITTDIQGRETYRYNFSTGGVWDGQRGELTRR